MIVHDWYGLYGGQWRDVVPDSSRHPAKFQRKLIRRIYQYAIEQGYLSPGDTVIDVFGGVALGAIDAMSFGLHWRGFELEWKFVDIGGGYDCPGFSKADWRRLHHRIKRCNWRFDEHTHFCPSCVSAMSTDEIDGRTIPTAAPHHYQGNIELWREMFADTIPGFGTAVLKQTDSRYLLQAMFGEGVVSSPPYSSLSLKVEDVDKLGKAANAGRRERGEIRGGVGRSGALGKSVSPDGYGDSPGQLSNLPSGAVGSPPFSVGEPRDRYQVSGGDIADQMTRAYTADQQGQSPHNLASMDGLLSSPAYINSLNSENHGIDFTKVKKDYPGRQQHADRVAMQNSHHNERRYGNTPGQMGGLPEGVISSPAYGTTIRSGEGPGARHDFITHSPENATTATNDQSYGSTPGQLVDLAMSSPPFEDQEPVQDKNFVITDGRRIPPQGQEGYENDPNNVGTVSGDTFWGASQMIVEQVYHAVKPGGVAIWVTKDFVRNKKRVEFTRMWLEMCVGVGFEPLEYIRAWVIEDKTNAIALLDIDDTSATITRLDGSQKAMSGTSLKKGGRARIQGGKLKPAVVERKSMFRRLAEAKGSPRIDWEDVLILRRP